MKIPFIDIHTHHLVNSAEIISVQSLFLQDIAFTSELEYPFSAAIHPWHSAKFEKGEVTVMLENLIPQKNLIAIGETGLDKASTTDYKIQKWLFEMHLDFAEVHHKPLIIHAVRSWNELLPILKKGSVPCILHGYSEGAQLTRQLIDFGCYFSVGMSILKPSTRFKDALKLIPPASLFLETDESPVPIEEIYHQMAKTLNMPLEVLKIQIYENFNTLLSVC